MKHKDLPFRKGEKMKVSKSVLAGVLSFLAVGAMAQSTRITYKSAKSTSSYYQMAVQLGEEINRVSNDSIKFTIEESQGSVQNVKEARKRKGNYVFTTPPVLVKLALKQKAMFKKDNPKDYENIRALFPIPFLTMHFVVRADSGVKSFKDLQGKSLLIGKGSFGAKEAKKYMKLFGLKDKVKLINAELSGAVAALKNGKVDGFATAGSYPAPNVIEASATTKINLLSMSDEQIKMTKRDKLVIPAGTYKGVDYDVSTTTLPVGVYTTTNMDEKVAYALTKAFWQAKPKLEQKSQWWKAITPDSIRMFHIKLHKGAIKYYKEIGVKIPKNLQ